MSANKKVNKDKNKLTDAMAATFAEYGSLPGCKLGKRRKAHRDLPPRWRRARFFTPEGEKILAVGPRGRAIVMEEGLDFKARLKRTVTEQLMMQLRERLGSGVEFAPVDDWGVALPPNEIRGSLEDGGDSCGHDPSQN